jgi:hypothetical protein
MSTVEKLLDEQEKIYGRKELWRGYGFVLLVRLVYITLASFEGASSDLSLYTNLALSFPGPFLVRFFVVDIGLFIFMFLYTSQKRWLPAMFWKTYFWLAVLADIVAHVYVSSQVTEPTDLTGLMKLWPMLMFNYLYIPAYFLLYRYAFR